MDETEERKRGRNKLLIPLLLILSLALFAAAETTIADIMYDTAELSGCLVIDLLIGIAPIVAVVFTTYNGLVYVSSPDDPSLRAEAKERITWIIIAMGMFLIAVIELNPLLEGFGVAPVTCGRLASASSIGCPLLRSIQASTVIMAMVFLSYFGMQFIANADNPSGRKSARSGMVGVIVGLMIALGGAQFIGGLFMGEEIANICPFIPKGTNIAFYVPMCNLIRMLQFLTIMVMAITLMFGGITLMTPSESPGGRSAGIQRIRNVFIGGGVMIVSMQVIASIYGGPVSTGCPRDVIGYDIHNPACLILRLLQGVIMIVAVVAMTWNSMKMMSASGSAEGRASGKKGLAQVFVGGFVMLMGIQLVNNIATGADMFGIGCPMYLNLNYSVCTMLLLIQQISLVFGAAFIMFFGLLYVSADRRGDRKIWMTAIRYVFFGCVVMIVGTHLVYAFLEGGPALNLNIFCPVPPVAVAEITSLNECSRVVSFDGTASSDRGGDAYMFGPSPQITEFRWEFGDGGWCQGYVGGPLWACGGPGASTCNNAECSLVTHTYVESGIFPVTLTVTDNDGLYGEDIVKAILPAFVELSLGPVSASGLDAPLFPGHNLNGNVYLNEPANISVLVTNSGDAGSRLKGVLVRFQIFHGGPMVSELIDSITIQGTSSKRASVLFKPGSVGAYNVDVYVDPYENIDECNDLDNTASTVFNPNTERYDTECKGGEIRFDPPMVQSTESFDIYATIYNRERSSPRWGPLGNRDPAVITVTFRACMIDPVGGCPVLGTLGGVTVPLGGSVDITDTLTLPGGGDIWDIRVNWEGGFHDNDIDIDPDGCGKQMLENDRPIAHAGSAYFCNPVDCKDLGIP